MLKFEKALNDKHVVLIFRKNSYFLSYPFLIAFSLALSFHLVFFVIFQIVPIKLHHNDLIFPPVAVETNIDAKNLIVVMDADPHLIVTNIPPLELSTPSLPKPPNPTMQQVEYAKENTNALNPFNGIEMATFQPIFNPLPKKTLPQVNVIISGALGTKQLLSNGLSKVAPIAHQKHPQNHPTRIVYHVIADGHTGRICWYEAKELTANASLNKMGEELLKNMLFVSEQIDFMTAGEVEIHLNGGNS